MWTRMDQHRSRAIEDEDPENTIIGAETYPEFL